MNPQTEFRSFSLEIRTNRGIIVATPGIIIARSRKANSLSLALSAYSSNPNPASEQTKRQKIVWKMA